MNTDVPYEMIKLCFSEGFTVLLPIAAVALSLGLTISILQTVTSVQDQTLSFVPKLFGTLLCIWLLSPWILAKLGGLMVALFQRSADVLP